MSDEQYVRDFIFPISLASIHDGQLRFEELLGTGFLLGNDGFALTAKHVLTDIKLEETNQIVALHRSNSSEWIACDFEADIHPNEDVALLKFKPHEKYSEDLSLTGWKSPFLLSDEWQGSSKEYMMWGYPDDLLHDVHAPERFGRVIPSPDLVHTKGYIRRRLSTELPSNRIKGKQFYEINIVAGNGFSGAPLWESINEIWHVYGVYVGARSREIKDNVHSNVGYAVRIHELEDWQPELLDNESILNNPTLHPSPEY